MKGNFRLIIGIGFGIVFFGWLFWFFIRWRRIMKYEKRFQSFSLKSSTEEELSLVDSLYAFFGNFICFGERILKKRAFFVRYSKKYERFAFLGRTSLGIVSEKLLVGLIAFLGSLMVSFKQFGIWNWLFWAGGFFLGFLIPDFFLNRRFEKYQWTMHEELCEAVGILNRCFKNGKSMRQAIDTVSTTMNGVMAREFEFIAKDLSFGLDFSQAFQRFYERTKLEEIAFIANTLSVLNQTGGTISYAFDAIELSLQQKQTIFRKQRDAKNILQGVAFFACFFPFLLMMVVLFINSSFYDGLFDTRGGFFIGVLVVLLYVFYILFVHSLLKEDVL